MAAPIRELLQFNAPVHFSVEGEGEGKPLDRLLIKGFASVETNDRSGDHTSPFEFNIREFMAAPSLLINHKFWIDHMGNSVAVGRVLTMHPVQLRKSSEAGMWDIYAIDTKEVINTYPKEKAPSLKKGDRGLFVTAEVTQPEVIQQVATGELSGMSWRGLVVIDFELDPQTHETVRVLKDIDLYEVSVTHIPDHNQSTFVVGKSVDGKMEEVEGMTLDSMQLWKVDLAKSKFISEGMAKEYLKAHNLNYEGLREDGEFYVADQLNKVKLDLEKTVRVRMGDAYMVMAPPVEVPKGQPSNSRLIAQLVGDTSQVEVAKSSTPIQETVIMSKDETGAVASTATETKTLETPGATPEVEKAAKEAKAKAEDKAKEEAAKKSDMKKEVAKSASEKQLEALGQAVSVGVVTALAPTLEKMTEGLNTLGTGMQAIVEKMAPGAATPASDDTKTNTNTNTEKAEVAKSVDFGDVMSVLNGLAANLEQTQLQVVEVAKSAMALGESIPNAGIERSETVDPKAEVAKSAISGQPIDEDVNACFDGTFPWLAGDE